MAMQRNDESITEIAHRLKLALEASSTGIWEWELDSNCVIWSAQCFEIHGLKEAEFDGTSAGFDRLVHPDDRQYTWEAVAAAIRDHSTYENSFRIIRPDGSVRWVKNRGRALYSPDGKPLRMVGTLNDITAAKEREEALKASDQRFRHLADALPQIVWTSDGQGSLNYCNLRWLDYTGLDLEKALGQTWVDCIHPDDRNATLEKWRAAVQDRSPYVIEHRVRRADGAYRWLLTRALWVPQSTSADELWFGTSTDVEEQKQLTHDLQAGARNKDNFLAVLAHELRNPLGAIKNAVHIAKATNAKPELLPDVVEIIDRQSTQLIRLVDDLSDISRIEHGKLKLRRAWLPIRDVIDTAVEAALANINAMQHDLRVHMPPSPVYVFADLTRLCQVVANLLNNAAKFTPRGGQIDLSVVTTDDELAITVKDNGIGISAIDLPRIFNMYAQFQKPDPAGKGGLGIGLSLAKALVARHEGSLEAFSDGPGSGSRFVVRLPIRRTAEGEKARSEQTRGTA